MRERELKPLFGLLFLVCFLVFGVCDNLRLKLYRPVCDIIIYNVMNVHLELMLPSALTMLHGSAAWEEYLLTRGGHKSRLCQSA